MCCLRLDVCDAMWGISSGLSFKSEFTETISGSLDMEEEVTLRRRNLFDRAHACVTTGNTYVEELVPDVRELGVGRDHGGDGFDRLRDLAGDFA